VQSPFPKILAFSVGVILVADISPLFAAFRPRSSKDSCDELPCLTSFVIAIIFPYILSIMIKVAVGILRRDGKILACQRKKGGRYELKWEFPGGKVEPGETIAECLIRELREELAISLRSIDGIEVQSAEYKDGGLFEVSYCNVSAFEGEPANVVFEQIRWVTREELKTLDILEGNRDYIAAMK
jgi:8-oxo-dGTP diphosphatase